MLHGTRFFGTYRCTKQVALVVNKVSDESLVVVVGESIRKVQKGIEMVQESIVHGSSIPMDELGTVQSIIEVDGSSFGAAKSIDSFLDVFGGGIPLEDLQIKNQTIFVRLNRRLHSLGSEHRVELVAMNRRSLGVQTQFGHGFQGLVLGVGQL